MYYTYTWNHLSVDIIHTLTSIAIECHQCGLAEGIFFQLCCHADVTRIHQKSDPKRSLGMHMQFGSALLALRCDIIYTQAVVTTLCSSFLFIHALTLPHACTVRLRNYWNLAPTVSTLSPSL